MGFMDLMYFCTNPPCQTVSAAEATPDEVGNRVIVYCGLCGKKKGYSKALLETNSLAAIKNTLHGFFDVHRRYY